MRDSRRRAEGHAQRGEADGRVAAAAASRTEPGKEEARGATAAGTAAHRCDAADGGRFCDVCWQRQRQQQQQHPQRRRQRQRRVVKRCSDDSEVEGAGEGEYRRVRSRRTRSSPCGAPSWISLAMTAMTMMTMIMMTMAAAAATATAATATATATTSANVPNTTRQEDAKTQQQREEEERKQQRQRQRQARARTQRRRALLQELGRGQQQDGGAAILTSLPAYDEVRAAGNAYRPYGTNVDLVYPEGEGFEGGGPAADGAEQPPSGPEPEYGICHVVLMQDFTRSLGDAYEPAYEVAAAVLLAVQQLNAGTLGETIVQNNHRARDDGAPPTEIDTARTQCPIKFTVEMADTRLSEGPALSGVIERTGRKSRSRPCAFLGAVRSAVSIPTSIITGLQGYPQMSGHSTSSDLDNKNQYPLFGRTIPSDNQNAVPIVLYFTQRLRIEHLSVLHVNDEYGNFFAEGLRVAAKQYAPHLTIYAVDIPPPNESNPASIRNAVSMLREKGYTYIFSIMFEIRLFDAVMEEAYQQGIAGNGLHNWFFSDSFNSALLNRPFRRDSPLHRAYQGVGLMEASGGIPGQALYDRFVSQLQQLKNPRDLQYLGSLIPRYHPNGQVEDDNTNENEQNNSTRTTGGDESDDAARAVTNPSTTKNSSVAATATATTTPFIYSDDFMAPLKSGYVSFVYEAAVAVGLAACHVAAENRRNNESIAFNGTAHYERIKQTQFTSMSGNIMFDPVTGTRKAEGVLLKVSNHIAIDHDPNQQNRTTTTTTNDGDEDVVYFESFVSDFYQNGEWNQIQDYIFNDGTGRIPPDLPPQIVRQDDFDLALEILSWLMLAVLWCAAAACIAWTQRRIDTRVVRASQPIFLHLISAGVVVMASAIIPSTVDNTSAETIDGCHAACNLFPWLFSMGFSVTFSALYTKAYRVLLIVASSNRFRRVKVTIRDVIKPMICHLGANVLLLSLMTALAPSEWVFHVDDHDKFGRPALIHGACSMSTERRAFVIALVLLNLSAVVLAIVQAWRTQKISTEFSESKYIFIVFLTMLFIGVVGVPVLILASDNPDASVFVMNAIVFTVGITILLWIFVPKVKSVMDCPTHRESTVFITGLNDAEFSPDAVSSLGLSNLNSSPSTWSKSLDYGSRVTSQYTLEELEKEVVELRRLLQVASLGAHLGNGSVHPNSRVTTPSQNTVSHTQSCSADTHSGGAEDGDSGRDEVNDSTHERTASVHTDDVSSPSSETDEHCRV